MTTEEYVGCSLLILTFGFTADIDECGSSPCQQEGNCTDLVNSFECSCPAGYDGTTCENGGFTKIV